MDDRAKGDGPSLLLSYLQVIHFIMNVIRGKTTGWNNYLV